MARITFVGRGIIKILMKRIKVFSASKAAADREEDGEKYLMIIAHIDECDMKNMWVNKVTTWYPQRLIQSSCSVHRGSSA